MLESTTRLLRLLSLLQSRRDWTGPDLAERLGCSTRTVRRDIDRLRELGYPIHASRGTAGYRLDAGSSLPPLLLDDDEAVAIVIGLRTAAARHITGIDETADRALEKLDRLLPSRLRHRVRALESVTFRQVRSPAIDLATLTTVAGAARDHVRLRFGYTDHAGTESARDVEPHSLVHTGRLWYLVAYDIGRADWRSFRLDRITPRQPYGPAFAARRIPGGDPIAFVARGVTGVKKRLWVRVRLHAPLETVLGRLPEAVRTVEPAEDGTCIVEFGADSIPQLALHLCELEVDAEIKEGPPALGEYLAALAARVVRMSPNAGPFTM